jgi:chromosome segregation ATPase
MDQELIAFLDVCFGETSQQIAGLREEMGGLRGELRGLRGEFEGFRAETGEKFDRVNEEIRKAGVLIEGVRHEVQVVAEGVTGANERLDAFRTEAEQEFKDVRSLIHLSYRDLDRRIRRPDEDGEGLKV